MGKPASEKTPDTGAIRHALKSSAIAKFRLRVSLGEEVAIGPGKIALLEQIQVSGSINAAAKQLGMSYRRAWLLIDEMNRCLSHPVVETATGGAHGGGTLLTPTGLKVVTLYRKIETDAAAATAADMRQLVRMLVKF